MTRFTDVICGWFGWCPNADTLRPTPVILTSPSAATEAAIPDGGSGGSGRLGRGASLTLGSLKVLFRNGHLLWFTFFTGFVLLFSLFSTIGLQYLSGTDPLTGAYPVTGLQPVLIMKGSWLWLALTFSSSLIAVFCTVFLLAGLVTCVSFLFSGRSATVREGVSRAWTHRTPLAGWAVISTLVSFFQVIITSFFPGDVALILISILLLVPVWILTVFVVPAIALEDRHLAGAVAASFSLIRKTWAEVLICIFIFMAIGFAAGLVSLVPAAAIGFPSGDPVLLALSIALYEFVLLIFIMIFSTAFGISLVGIFSYARTGRMPRAFEEKQNGRVPV